MAAKKKKIASKNQSFQLATNVVKAHPIYTGVVILWIMYLFVQMGLPNTTSNQIRVSDSVLQLLRLSIAIPYLLIWLSAAFAYIKMKRYALGIAPSVESKAFNNIAKGILLLLASLILASMLSTARSYFTSNLELRPILTILTNYAYVLPYFAAFVFILKGTSQLTRQNGSLKLHQNIYVVFSIFLVALAYLWLEVIFSNPSRMVPGPGSSFATYYLKDSLLILTIVIPSLITWTIGLLSIIKLRMYYDKVKGIIYKRALSSVVNGLGGVILGSIFLQALNSLGAQRLVVLGLGRVLALIYIFILIQTVGYFFIASGANKLTKIETV